MVAGSSENCIEMPVRQITEVGSSSDIMVYPLKDSLDTIADLIHNGAL
jgi:hypothetical protein